MIASFLHHKIESKKKNRERERDKKKQCNFHLVPDFEECSLSVTYYERSKYVSATSHFFLGNLQNISYFSWWSTELANKEERRRTPIALWWRAAPRSCDSFWMMAALLPASALALLLCERDTHTQARTHTHTHTWVLLKFASHDECAFCECQVVYKVGFFSSEDTMS
jgi:hypothetical protein